MPDVVRADIENVDRDRGGAEPVPQSAAAPARPTQPTRGSPPAAPLAAVAARPVPVVAVPLALAPDAEEIPLTTVRRLTAQRLAASAREAPHFYLTVVADAGDLLAFRAQANEGGRGGGQGHGADVKITVTDLLIRACATALATHPEINVSWDETRILRHTHVNIGIAVAIDDGLIVPVIRDADRKTLAALRDRGVSGVTTNPTIFARAISHSDAYACQIRDLKLRQVTVDQALRELTTSDVRQACDMLRPAYEATGGVDGRVSIEVDPRIAHDTDRTAAEARALWWLVDRPNLFVKIPAARQGLPAITACLAEGISINVTLISSLARYGEVIDAFLAGMEHPRAAGRDLSGIASVASFFVSRVDTEVDKRLDKTGTPQAAALRGKSAIANARLAYQRYEESVATERWKSLEQAGARPQWPLWASTSVKNPAYEDTRYVTGLVAPGVINTMPEATLNAVADHADIPDDSIHGSYADAQTALDDLAALGIDYDDVVQALEDQGVTAFDASWDHLGQQLAIALGTRQE